MLGYKFPGDVAGKGFPDMFGAAADVFEHIRVIVFLEGSAFSQPHIRYCEFIPSEHTHIRVPWAFGSIGEYFKAYTALIEVGEEEGDIMETAVMVSSGHGIYFSTGKG